MNCNIFQDQEWYDQRKRYISSDDSQLLVACNITISQNLKNEVIKLLSNRNKYVYNQLSTFTRYLSVLEAEVGKIVIIYIWHVLSLNSRFFF